MPEKLARGTQGGSTPAQPRPSTLLLISGESTGAWDSAGGGERAHIPCRALPLTLASHHLGHKDGSVLQKHP